MMYKVYCDDYLIYDTHIDNLNLINPKLNLELNKTGSFDFTIYPSNPYFNDLHKLKSIIKVFQDDYLLFRGRILNDEQGFYNEKQVTCEGELAFLLDSIQRPYDFMTDDKHTTIKDLFTFFIENHNSQVNPDQRFKVGEITVTDPNDYIVRSDSTYLNTWESINKKLIETNGGYLWVRHEADGNYIDYLSDFKTISPQKIEFGKNLLDINKIIKGEDLATAIIPLGEKTTGESSRLTIESVNNGKDYVFDQEAVDKYGWIFKTVTFDDVTLPENLLSKGRQYLSDSINFVVSIELNAADLSTVNKDISSFKMGSYIKVTTKPHALDQLFLVTKLSINLLSPAGNKLTLGTKYLSLTEQTAASDKDYDGILTKVERIEKDVSNIDIDVNDQINSAVEMVVEQTASSIGQMSDEILFQVNEKHYLKEDTDMLINSMETEFSQTKDTFEFRFNQFMQDLQDVQNGSDAQFQEISKYIRFIDGNIILGETGNELTLKIQHDRISFMEGNFEIAYWKNKQFYAVDGEFINSLKLGKFAFIPRENGNLSFKKVVE